MLDSHGRFAYQSRFLDPLLSWSIWRNVSPHSITIAGCLVGIAIWPLLMWNLTILAVMALLCSGFLDTLDGSLARYQGSSSPQGAALDIFCDRVVEFSVLLGLYEVDPEVRAIPILFMLGSVLLCITSFLVVGIFSENDSNKAFYYSPGLIERTEAFGFFLLMMIWPSFFTPLAWIFSLLVFLTALIRLWQFFRYSRFIPVKVKTSDD
jgi:phosphatidylglycerophosphate synthase